MLGLMRRHHSRSRHDIDQILEMNSSDPKQMMKELECWLEALDFNDEKAMLQIEMDLHAQRNPGFAKDYYAVSGQHKDVFTEIL